MTALLLFVGEALARAGGGGGFSGGGGDGGGYSGGGGDGGGGDAIFRLLIWLVFSHPVIGIPVLIVVVVAWVMLQSQKAGTQFDRTVVRGPARPLAPPPRSSAADRAELLRRDPTFSEVLFLDFARLVFVRAHEERGRKNLASLTALLAPEAIRALEARESGAVRDVILGTVQLRSLTVAGDEARAVVKFVANHTVGERVLLTEEWWAFARNADVRSPGPEKMQALRCPSCGSALDSRPDGSCVNCNAPLADGAHLWRVIGTDVRDVRDVPNLSLELGGGVESGTTLPLRRAADFAANQRALTARHPEFDEIAFNRRAAEIFLKVQEAWSAMNPEAIRGLETDGVFQSHRYWIERYRREGLKNRAANVSVTGVMPARIQMDAFYTAITVRIFATMLDWTENASGKVVGGSRTEPKRFSEYWTFVRSAGKPLAPGGATTVCPSCGAPLDRVGESGVCGYCDAKITTGDFDWVVAAIDQDDVYEG